MASSSFFSIYRVFVKPLFPCQLEKKLILYKAKNHNFLFLKEKNVNNL
ncbi:hypothetical protein CP10881SC42_0647 [Chlamydia avium]|uniref:Uncharacterized protein n=1 Tax=Chlamydia avium TaxID=1457141 RepID=A0ABP2X6A2_9CHLA|nr:hypothetical protein CP10743SC13_0563 [Chlamydia psittaci 10_743_SC13]EPP38359.1 hypothetical protein CP10881SC42_0647 [Chlamydia avium]